ncbi:MAG TPA: dienelactone hydrolase family protein [Spongiibacteraceae bacterium]
MHYGLIEMIDCRRKFYCYSRRILLLAMLSLLGACAINPAKQVMPLEQGLDIYRTEKASAPTVLLVPGCGGLVANGSAAFFPRIAKKLNDNGFNAIVLDYVRIMGQDNACLNQIKFEKVVALINAALAYTAAQPYVDREHIALLGWSLGGSGVLTVADKIAANDQPDITAVAAYYPGCYSGLHLSFHPTLLLSGLADNVVDANACIALAKQSPQTPLVLKTYEGAQHCFDVEEFKKPQSTRFLWKKFTVAYDEAAADDAERTLLQFLEKYNRF